MITLDVTGRGPIYEQICDRISELIASGILKEDQKLPGARTLAKDLGLNPNTVAKAYSRLEHDGVIYSVSGVGCFVAKQAGSIQRKLMGTFRNAAEAALNAGVEKQELCDAVEEISQAIREQRAERLTAPVITETEERTGDSQ